MMFVLFKSNTTGALKRKQANQIQH